jgi:hypothetical protein
VGGEAGHHDLVDERMRELRPHARPALAPGPGSARQRVRAALALVSGESGIGKTRLLGELERRLAGGEEPPRVLHGEAVQQGEGELP